MSTSPRLVSLFRLLLAAILLLTGASAARALTATPSTTEGPYYTFSSQNQVVQSGSSVYDAHFFTTEGTDNDLTHIYADSTQSNGTLFLLSGTLVNTAGAAVGGAVVELWEADNNGVYNYVSSSSGTNNYAGRDKNFQGFGKTTTDSTGAWSFRTIKPGKYTGRIRHFHFKVIIGGSTILTSQFVFSEDSASFTSDGVAAPLARAGTIGLVTLTPTSGTDSSGNAAQIASKQIVINYTVSSASAPTITTQPTSETVALGASASFSVAASGDGTLSYQWYKGYTAISGATGASYTIASVTAEDAGSYDVVVTNSAGSVTSSTATLTVEGSSDVAIVSVRAGGDATIQSGVENGRLIFVRSGGDTASELTVYFKVKGSATEGTDFSEKDGSALGTSVTFPAGATKLKVKLAGISDGQAGGTKKVVVKLTASPTGAYVIGDVGRAQFAVIDGD